MSPHSEQEEAFQRSWEWAIKQEKAIERQAERTRQAFSAVLTIVLFMLPIGFAAGYVPTWLSVWLWIAFSASAITCLANIINAVRR